MRIAAVDVVQGETVGDRTGDFDREPVVRRRATESDGEPVGGRRVAYIDREPVGGRRMAADFKNHLEGGWQQTLMEGIESQMEIGW